MQLHSDPTFDRLLLRSLSVAANGFADATTIAGAGARVAPGDVVSWERYWRRAGDRAIERADQRLAVDDVAGARRTLLCASWAYGQAAHFYRVDPACETWRTNRASQICAFRAAMPLLPDECEVLVVPGHTSSCDGYLFGRADPGGNYVVIPVGAEESAEDAYALFAPTAGVVGVRCLVIDFPVDADTAMMEAALNWLTPRTSRVFVLGWSAMAPRAVAVVRHRQGLRGVLCCPDAADVVAVCALLPELRCPSMLLPPALSVLAGFSWMASAVT